jgi:hypothetical protein
MHKNNRTTTVNNVDCKPEQYKNSDLGIKAAKDSTERNERWKELCEQ